MVTADSSVFTLKGVRASCRDCSLSELCLPRGLSVEDMRKFETLVQQKKPLKRGESLYREGEKFTCLYAVKSGSLKTMMLTPDGDEQIVGFHMPGELIGFDGMYDHHSCSAMAMERTVLCALPVNEIEEAACTIQGLHRQLCGIMGRELNHDQTMLLLLARLSADERLAAFIVSLSSRFRRRGFSDQRFILSMTRHDIANYLGLAPETVSRVLGRFQKNGMISINRREVRINDFEGLRQYVRMTPSSSRAESSNHP